jgi:hypothetical protein
MRRRISLLAGWIALSVLCASLYGVLNDQITVTISPEYFSVFKREQFDLLLSSIGLENAPTRIQSVAVGIASTWWVGLFLGLVLSVVGVAGRRPASSTSMYLRAVAGIMGFAFGLSVLAGIVGYATAPHINPTAAYGPFLVGIQDVRRAMVVGFWHDAAYLGGLLGTVAAACWLHRLRRRDAAASVSQS